MKSAINSMGLCEVNEEAVKATVAKAKTSSKKINANLALMAVEDAVESATSAEVTEASLDAEFAAIKKRAKEAMNLRVKGRVQFYTALVELLMFWVRASKERNYLDKFYGADDSEHKRKVNHGHNFAPLIAEAWAGVVDMDTNKKNRWSRAMNQLFKLYEAEQSYQTDTLNSLVKLLVENGLDYYVNYGQNKKTNGDDVADYVADTAMLKKNRKVISLAEIKKLYPVGAQHFNKANIVSHAKLNITLPLSDDAISLVLLRNIGNDEYAVISATADSKLVQESVVQKYVSDFSATPQAMRVLYESMATQCPPNELKHIYTKLVDKAGSFVDGTVKNSVRRLFYKHDVGQFIMSPIRADSGVVTVVKPKVTVLKKPDCDVFLNTVSRRKLEENIISPRKSNTYQANNLGRDGVLNKDSDNFHTTKLTGATAEDKIDVIFGPELSKKESLSQVIVKSWAESKADWSVELPVDWLKVFENSFTSKWLASHGQHIVRSHQKMLELEFGGKSIKVSFFEKENEFDLENEVLFKVDHVFGKPKKLRVLSKDFAIAMHALSDMLLVGQIRVFLINDFIALKYETDVGFYELYIPACDDKGVRKTKGFTKYQLGIYEPDEFDCATAQSEVEMAEVL